jgi:hypothetical protein
MTIKNIALLLTLSTFSFMMQAENPALNVHNNRQSPITIIVEKYNPSRPGYVSDLTTSRQEITIAPNSTKNLGSIPHWNRKLDGCIANLSIKQEGFLSSPINLEKIIEAIMNQESKHPNKSCKLTINPGNQSSAYPINIGWQ